MTHVRTTKVEVPPSVCEPYEPLTVFPALAPLFGRKWRGRVATDETINFPCSRCVGLEVCKVLQALQSTWVLCEAPDERDLVCWETQGFDVREFVKGLPTGVTTVALLSSEVGGSEARVRGPTNVNTKTELKDRWCSTCSQWKLVTEFNRSRRDGWQARCRPCHNEYNRDPGRRARWEENRRQKVMQRG